MLAFVETEFLLNEPQDDKQPLRFHLEKVYQRTGVMPELLKQGKCPELFEYCWQDFLELNSTRTSNGFGLNAITYNEIDCWARLLNKPITANDIDVIKQIDNVYLTYQAERIKKQRE